MIRIIKHGDKNRIQCNYCDSLLSFQKSDIIQKEIYTGPRETWISNFIHCPVCENEIEVPSERL